MKAIQVATVTKALAHFIRGLDQWDSPFDRYVRGETPFLDPAAKRGFNLFTGKAACATCHFPPTFGGIVPPRYTETESEVLGVPETFPATAGSSLRFDGDLGRGLVHHNPIFRRAFKTPSVRNAELTGPYMHNGGINTLNDVLDFYNAGGGVGLGLDVPHQTLPPDSLGLTRREMNDIVAFMKSLTHGRGMEIPNAE
jgi:cytochrome c peroxidase